MHTPRDKATMLRAKAAEFHGQSTQARSVEERLRFLELASHYLQLARDIEERAQASASNKPRAGA